MSHHSRGTLQFVQTVSCSSSNWPIPHLQPLCILGHVMRHSTNKYPLQCRKYTQSINIKNVWHFNYFSIFRHTLVVLTTIKSFYSIKIMNCLVKTHMFIHRFVIPVTLVNIKLSLVSDFLKLNLTDWLTEWTKRQQPNQSPEGIQWIFNVARKSRTGGELQLPRKQKKLLVQW